MKVFISWSGERSGRLATALQQWIPRVIQAVSPWLSSGSIEPGERWSDEVATALEEMQSGVLCLTPENRSSPWILFEAGALSKAVSKSRVIPYLLGFEPRELQGPLAQFQAVRADEAGTLRLLSAINTAQGEPLLAPDMLAEAFQVWWLRIEPIIKELASAAPSEPPPPARSTEDMLGEVLEILRPARFAVGEFQVPPLPKTLESASSFGSRVRELRQLMGMTQIELAKRVAYSVSSISRIESGSFKPSLETILRIAAALNMHPQYLLESAGIVGLQGLVTDGEKAPPDLPAA